MTRGTRRAGGDFVSPRTSPLANGFPRSRRATAAGVLLSGEMHIFGRGFWSALGFLGLIVLGRGQYTVTSAYADLDAGAIWDDPQTLDVADINALVSFAIPFADPTRQAKEWLSAALPRRGQVLAIRGVGVPSPVVPFSQTRAPPAS